MLYTVVYLEALAESCVQKRRNTWQRYTCCLFLETSMSKCIILSMHFSEVKNQPQFANVNQKRKVSPNFHSPNKLKKKDRASTTCRKPSRSFLIAFSAIALRRRDWKIRLGQKHSDIFNVGLATPSQHDQQLEDLWGLLLANSDRPQKTPLKIVVSFLPFGAPTVQAICLRDASVFSWNVALYPDVGLNLFPTLQWTRLKKPGARTLIWTWAEGFCKDPN